MMRASILAAMLLSACATVPGEAPPASATPMAEKSVEEEAILAVVDRFMLAIGNHDGPAIEELLATDGVAYFQFLDAEGKGRVQAFPNATLMEVEPDSDPFIERYWDPVVMVRGGIATVWAPYELRDNGEVVHCGIDTLYMVKAADEWLIGNLMSTMEPAGCAELRPPSASAMRPQNGWRETRLE